MEESSQKVQKQDRFRKSSLFVLASDCFLFVIGVFAIEFAAGDLLLRGVVDKMPNFAVFCEV